MYVSVSGQSRDTWNKKSGTRYNEDQKQKSICFLVLFDFYGINFVFFIGSLLIIDHYVKRIYFQSLDLRSFFCCMSIPPVIPFVRIFPQLKKCENLHILLYITTIIEFRFSDLLAFLYFFKISLLDLKSSYAKTKGGGI